MNHAIGAPSTASARLQTGWKLTETVLGALVQGERRSIFHEPSACLV